jgi:uncharacterized protein YndB with AHSA1/START domain
MNAMTPARAVADMSEGLILATVEIARPPERVFQALASTETASWWQRPGVFTTESWQGDLRPGGTWRATGTGKAGPFVLEGEFLEVDPPRRLVHSWKLVGTPGAPTTVSYQLEEIEGGTRLTLRHWGFGAPMATEANLAGWETSFVRLIEILA